MDGTEGEIPEKALLYLGSDVAFWLHEQADRFFRRDVNEALNGVLRSVMQAQRAPHDPWARQDALLRAAQRPAGGSPEGS